MNFNSLVWYSSLAIGDEKNNYVFLIPDRFALQEHERQFDVYK